MMWTHLRICVRASWAGTRSAIIGERAATGDEHGVTPANTTEDPSFDICASKLACGARRASYCSRLDELPPRSA